MIAELEDLVDLSAKREQEYQAAARRWAIEGERIALEDIETICLRAKRDPSDFKSLVGTLQRRQAERVKYATKSTLEDERAQLQADLKAANEALEAAVALHQQTCYPIQVRTDQLNREIAELSQIPQKLLAGCPNRALDERGADLAQYLSSASKHESEARRHLTDQQSTLRQAAARACVTLDAEWLNGVPEGPQLTGDDNIAMFKNRVLRAADALRAARQREAELQQELSQNTRDQMNY